jgi:hypothetical protein
VGAGIFSRGEAWHRKIWLPECHLLIWSLYVQMLGGHRFVMEAVHRCEMEVESLQVDAHRGLRSRVSTCSRSGKIGG